MALTAQLSSHQNQTLVSLAGQLDYEYAKYFMDRLPSMELTNEIVIDFREVNLIGSSCLRNFFEMLELFALKSQKTILITGLDDNFIKVFNLFRLNENLIKLSKVNEEQLLLSRINQ
jgi:anti-anti-sigma factor